MEMTLMKYSVLYPTSLEWIDPKNDTVDVCVRFEDGQECTFVFTTPAHIVTMMKERGVSFLEPWIPFLYVEELTNDNILDCLDAISDDQAMRNIYGADIIHLMDHWKP